MVDPNLPADLVSFFQQGTQPDYDPALFNAPDVTLLPLDKLKVEFFPMTPESTEDPHAREGGSYLVAGVSLLASCDGYDPVGVLLWLPIDGRYGTWDGEHGTLRVFREEVGWSVIAEDLPRYVNAQWDEDAPVSDLIPWDRHPFNAEQLFHPLPDIAEWYEAKWVRRGEYRNGVQLRYPKELRIRIESDSQGIEMTARTKKAEKDPQWSPPDTHSLGPDSLERIARQLERGFWSQPTSAPFVRGGETETYWTISGYKASKYHSLLRSYEAGRAQGDAVHELGMDLARLANLNHFMADD